MGTHSDDFEFAAWALKQGKFKWNTSKRTAEFLLAQPWRGGLVAHSNGYDLLAVDLYELLRLSEPEAWSTYCAMEEDYWETKSRLDDARGKRY
jgi:hypothetical protein